VLLVCRGITVLLGIYEFDLLFEALLVLWKSVLNKLGLKGFM